jgi:hypothetical protein
MEITALGIALAKSVFQLHGVDASFLSPRVVFQLSVEERKTPADG